jgi:hypothetical protein
VLRSELGYNGLKIKVTVKAEKRVKKAENKKEQVKVRTPKRRRRKDQEQ